MGSQAGATAPAEHSREIENEQTGNEDKGVRVLEGGGQEGGLAPLVFF